MGFVSKDETDKLGFEDCVIQEFKREGSRLSMLLDALIIKARNSQNSNYTDSYADTTSCVMDHIEIVGILKEGFNYYDADGNLLKEVLDEPVAPDDYPELFKSFEGAYLTRFEKLPEEYLIEVELSDEDDGTVGDSYELHIAGDPVVFKWDRYLNRVQP